MNVTNITYTNSTVYNYGPDYNTLSRYSTRPIQRLSLQRETTVDPAAAAQTKSLMKVQGDKLVVAAPQQFQKPAKTVAPKVVKEKIAQPQLERGWEPVSNPKKQAELKEKFKKEDPKSVPPPTVQGSRKTEASPAPSVSASPVTTPVAPPPRDRRKDKQNDNGAPDQSSLRSAPPPPITKPEKADKSKSEPAVENAMKKQPAQKLVQPPSKANPPANPPGKDDGKKQKRNERPSAPSP